MNTPAVSVVVPCLNAEHYIRDCLDSLLSCGCPDLEVIVMDGGSIDGTIRILNEYESRLAYVESTSDRGQSHAINKGFRKARGRYVTWLCADDVVMPGVYGQAAAYLDEHDECAIVYGDVVTCDAGLIPIHLAKWETLTLDELLYSNSSVPQPGSLYRKQAIDEVGNLDESLHFTMDLDLYVRILEKGHTAHNIDSTAARFRLSPHSKSERFEKNFRREKSLILRRFGMRTMPQRLRLSSVGLKHLIKRNLQASGLGLLAWKLTSHGMPWIFSNVFRGRILGLLVARHFGNIKAGKHTSISNPESVIIGSNVSVEPFSSLQGPVTVAMDTRWHRRQ